VVLHADWATYRPCFEVSFPCCYSCLRFFVTTRDAHCCGASLSYLFCSSEYEASILYRTLAGIIPVVFWISSRGLLHAYCLLLFGVIGEESVGGSESEIQKASQKTRTSDYEGGYHMNVNI
jgi:hypothetical protein